MRQPMDARRSSISNGDAAWLFRAKPKARVFAGEPVTRKKLLEDQLNGTYTGIGATVTVIKQTKNSVVHRRLAVVAPVPGGPADKAGVLLGDVLFELDGKSVADTDSVQESLGRASVGKALQARFIRAGSVIQINIELGARQ